MVNALEVELGNRSYPIYIGQQLSSEITKRVLALIESGTQVAIVSDKNVVSSQFGLFQELKQETEGRVHVRSLEPGESTKSLQQLGGIFDWLAEQKIDRSGVLMAVGGGVIGDLGGFAAASYLRGIDFYQVPTTLLSMVDSSVGGKTGINLTAGKNLVGAFYQPQAVFVDTDLLETLPAREFSAGMAEVIKYGMLYDRALFDQLVSLERLTFDHPELGGIIRRCCQIKAEIVKADERETAKNGGRALLNLGHTFAHGIENAAGYGEYLHGEAVGVGLVLASRLSQRMGCLSDSDVEQVTELVARYELPVALREPLKVDALLQAMMRDKKVRRGKMRFVAMQSIGQAVTIDDVSENWIHELWLEAGASE